MIWARLLDGTNVEIDLNRLDAGMQHLRQQAEEAGWPIATEVARWSETVVLHDVLGRAIPKRTIVLTWETA